MSSLEPVEGAQTASAAIFAALGDPHRLGLITRLSDGQPRSIVRLTADFRLSRQAITKHLRVLEQVGIVEAQRRGRENRYSYVPGALGPAQSYLETVSKQWDDALARLKSFVED